MSEQHKLWFYTDAKSIVSSPEVYTTSVPTPSQVTIKVAPKGNNYHIRRDFGLQDDDWVIYGVASTSNVDLVDDVVDAEEVFSESLEEFVNTGRIFWEHGYKLAGKVEADNPITAPIGVPYLVEIYNGELLVYIVLDKTHPTSRMVWERVNQDDKRFAKGIGLSIGALPQGKPSMMKDPMTGNYVKKCPKMRLYEISVTGQPINPYTWTEVVKSFLAEEIKEEESMATKNSKKVTKSVKEKKPVTKALEDEGVGMEPADPMAAGGADPMAAAAPAPDAGMDPMAGGMEDPMAAGGADPMAAADPMGADPMAGGMDPAMGADPMGGDPMGGGDGMLDMLGGGGDDATGLEPALGGDESDIGQDVVLDKVDMLASQVAQILEILSAESDVEDVADAVEDSEAPVIEETPAPDGEESDAGESDEEAVSEPSDADSGEDDEEDALEAISKSLAAQADRTDLIFDMIKLIPGLVKSVESLATRLDSMDVTPSTTKTVNVTGKSKSGVDADRASYEASTKSVGATKAGTVTKGVAAGKQHPGYVDGAVADARNTEVTPQDEEVVIKSILANDNQLSLLAELVTTFKSLNGNPVYVAEKKHEIYSIAEETLGLSRTGFRRAASLVKLD